MLYSFCFLFFFNDTATTEIYTLSLHDALPISPWRRRYRRNGLVATDCRERMPRQERCEVLRDRKSTRLNSSYGYISYAVFCLKKKKKNNNKQNIYHKLNNYYNQQQLARD